MARLVAEIDDTLYKKFKIIAMREDKTVKEKITELIKKGCFDQLYEIKHIDMNEINEILQDNDYVQINLINGHMIGYSEKRKPLVDEEVLLVITNYDFEESKSLGLNFNEWICESLNDTDYAKANFVKFLPN